MTKSTAHERKMTKGAVAISLVRAKILAKKKAKNEQRRK